MGGQVPNSSAKKFCNEKSAIFIVLPEEDQTKYFMVSLILQNLYREILTVADENGGLLKNRVVFFADELGTSMSPLDREAENISSSD